MNFSLIVVVIAAGFILFIGLGIMSNVTEMVANTTMPDGVSTNVTQAFGTMASFGGLQLMTVLPVVLAASAIIAAVVGGFMYKQTPTVEPNYVGYDDYEQHYDEEEDEEQTVPLVAYNCLNCGAPLDFQNGQTLTKCNYCGGQMKRRL